MGMPRAGPPLGRGVRPSGRAGACARFERLLTQRRRISVIEQRRQEEGRRKRTLFFLVRVALDRTGRPE